MGFRGLPLRHLINILQFQYFINIRLCKFVALFCIRDSLVKNYFSVLALMSMSDSHHESQNQRVS